MGGVITVPEIARTDHESNLYLLPLLLIALGRFDGATKRRLPSAAMPKVAFAFSNNSDPFWSIVETGCNKVGTEHGVDIVFKKPSPAMPPSRRRSSTVWSAQNIKAISVSVIDPKNQTAYLDEVAAKVPLLAVDNDAPQSSGAATSARDNYAAGRAAGQLVKEAMPDGGVVAIFVGQTRRSMPASVARECSTNWPAHRACPIPTTCRRCRPARQYGKYKLHKIYTDQPEGDQVCKQKATNALIELEKEPNVCMVGLWAYNPPAILRGQGSKRPAK